MNAFDATVLARQEMIQHGIGDWTFQLDRAKRRAGCCKYSSRTISLSLYYVTRNSIEEVKDTILHEIAHALTPGHGHNHVWKTVCRRIGAKPIRCYNSTTVDMPKGKYKATCGGCLKDFHRHRRPKTNTFIYCIKCGPENGLLHYKNHQAYTSVTTT